MSAVPALPQRLAGLGVLGLGLCWSLGVFLAHSDEVAASGLPLLTAFGHVAVGGVGAVFAAWFGTGAVLYAMTRLVGARPPFRGVLWAYAAAMPPLWVGAPAMAFIAAGATGFVTAVVVAVATIAFLALVLQTVGEVTGLSPVRVAIALGLTAIFCLSVISLS